VPWPMSTKIAVLITAFTLLTPLKKSAASPLAVYSVGNSLTADLHASGGVGALAHDGGRPLSHDYHVRCGSSLTGIVANATQTCIPPLVFGSLTEAFATQAAWQIDAVSLQPFYGATIREEIAAARTIIDAIRGSPAGRNTRIFIYATWPSSSDGPIHETWTTEYVSLDSPFQPSRKAYDIFLTAVQQFEPNASLIPAGHAWVAVAKASETQHRFVGINGPVDLYRDDIHASNLGRYVAGLAAHAAIVGEAAPFDAVPWQYSLNGYGTAPHPADLTTLHEITWDTVYPVPEPRPGLAAVTISAGILLLIGRVAVRRRAETMSSAFGAI